MEINIPPKGERQDLGRRKLRIRIVIIQNVQIQDAALVLLPKDAGRTAAAIPYRAPASAVGGRDSAMRYDADLTIPKPPGTVKSTGNFGPWNASEPGDTPLQGDYTFDNADLGIFAAIAGTLVFERNF